MPLHDYYCNSCGYSFEKVVKWDDYEIPCPQCGTLAKRAYESFNGIKHNAPDWLQGTLDVVDKDGGQHCQEFLKHPNRDNYHNWMKGEGLRPMEDGEKLRKPGIDKEARLRHREKVKESFRKRQAITIS